MKYILILIIGLFSGAYTAQNSAQDLLNKVVEKTSLVNDYSASVLIKPDVPMIKSLPVKAKIYFKKKDKFKVVSKSIAILPKQGFTDVNVFLSNPKNYMVVEAGAKVINNTTTRLLTVIANESSSEIILAKLYVHPKHYVILESEITTRSSGTVKVNYKYSSQLSYGLPSQIKFTVDVKEFKMPKSFSTNPHKSGVSKKNKRKTGTIVLDITNYVVNKGVSDSIFQK